MDMKRVENAVAKVERFVNPADWIPGLSSFTGNLRILSGAVEVVAGVVFAALKICAIIWTGKGSYSQVIKQGGMYSLHGLGNIARGCVAIVPFWNLSLFVYDKRIGRMNYEREIVPSKVYPLYKTSSWVPVAG